MINLYVLRSLVNRDLYVGICEDLRRRIKDHENGKNRYTKGLRPWELVHSETFPDWPAARKKEKYYKSGAGKEYLKSLMVP
jgi:putative endonuclease